jgi:hypothetical protein
MGDRRSLCEMSSIPPENLLLAVPKKGRLYDKCMKLLEGVGLEHKRPERLDFANCINMPVRAKMRRDRTGTCIQKLQKQLHTHTITADKSLTTDLLLQFFFPITLPHAAGLYSFD